MGFLLLGLELCESIFMGQGQNVLVILARSLLKSALEVIESWALSLLFRTFPFWILMHLIWPHLALR